MPGWAESVDLTESGFCRGPLKRLRDREEMPFEGRERSMTKPAKSAPLTAIELRAMGEFKTKLDQHLGRDLLSVQLFGSRARGEGGEESDLDLLIVVREANRSLCRRIVEMSLEIDLAFGTNLAPTILSEREYEQNREYLTPFYRSIEREGVPL
jgi:uncharacterized protein